MNKPVKVIISVLILIIIGFVVFLIVHLKGNQNMKDSQIKYMHFYYSTGTMIDAWVRYDIDKNDNKYIATIKPNGISEEEALKVDIKEDFINQLRTILNECEVNKWDNFNKNDPNVLDGNSFSFYLAFENGDDIEASGYMKYPKNYGELKTKLDYLFMKLYEDSK